MMKNQIQKTHRMKKLKVCSNCKGKIDISIDRHNKKYCSKDCSDKVGLKKANQKYRDKNYVAFKWRIKRICEKCSEEYIPNRIQQKFCSKDCADKVFKERYERRSEGIIISIKGKLSNFLKLRFEIFKRDNFSCQYCGRNVREDKVKLNIDHIHPYKKGGIFRADNLITSCVECNLGKGDTLLEERKLNSLSINKVNENEINK